MKTLYESILDKDWDFDDRKLLEFSQELCDLFEICHWKKKGPKQYVVSGDLNVWQKFLQCIFDIQENFWSSNTNKDSFIDLYLYYPYSSSSDIYKANCAQFQFNDKVYRIEGEYALTIKEERGKLKHPCGNYTSVRLPGEVIFAIKLFMK